MSDSTSSVSFIRAVNRTPALAGRCDAVSVLLIRLFWSANRWGPDNVRLATAVVVVEFFLLLRDALLSFGGLGATRTVAVLR